MAGDGESSSPTPEHYDRFPRIENLSRVVSDFPIPGDEDVVLFSSSKRNQPLFSGQCCAFFSTVHSLAFGTALPASAVLPLLSDPLAALCPSAIFIAASIAVHRTVAC